MAINMIKKDNTILFQGDSITDCGRDRINDTLGHGYPYLIASVMGAMYPKLNLKFINRGISGNRTKDLCARWEKDCLDIKPDILSVLIGINDTWRRFDKNEPTAANEYYDNYKEIIKKTRDCLGDIPIIIMEPFLLPYPADRIAWREDLDLKIQKARQIAFEFNCSYIPLDGIFSQNSMKTEPKYWAADGVHPTLYGHALIARHWMDATKL